MVKNLLRFALAAALSGGAAAQEPATPDGAGDEAQVAPRRHLTGGEIASLSEDSFQIRPWEVRLPRRLQVMATGSTVYYHQKSGTVKDLKAGDFVLVVFEKAPSKDDEPDSAADSRASKPSRPPSIRAVLRLAEPPVAAVSAQDRDRARALLQAARPFFKGKRRGGSAKPEVRSGTMLGTLASVEPFVLTAGDRPRPYRLKAETLVINHLKLTPGDLKKGHSVIVQSGAKPGADGTIQALLVAVSPKPRLNPRWERKLMLREKGRKPEN